MINIRKFEEKDYSLILQFYERAVAKDEIERKATAFEWIQRQNPVQDQNLRYILVFDSDKVVGYFGLMPTRFYLSGQSFLAGFGQEILIDPAFRGKGLGRMLLSEVNRNNKPIFGLWMNETVLQMIRKAGWIHIGYFKPLKKIHKLSVLAKPRFAAEMTRRPLTILGALLEAKRGSATTPWDRKYKVEPVMRCGEEFDVLFHEIAPHLGIVSERTAAILNWKYLNIPHKKYKIFCVNKGGKLFGYAVIRLEIIGENLRKGIIVDLLARPEEPEALDCLIEKCDMVFRQENVDFSVCLVLPQRFQKILARRGYFQSRTRPTDSLLIYNEGTMPDHYKSGSIENWYLTYGESDGDMW